MKRVVWRAGWMGVLLLSGCAPEVAKEAVFVDLAAVSQSLPAPATPPDPNQSGMKPISGMRIDIPPLPPTTLSSPKGKDEVQIRATIEAARLKAKRQLQNRLRDVYFEELDRAQEEAIAALGPEMALEAEKIRQSQMALFKNYAEERGFRMARLALLAGFPDQDPNSLRPKPENAIAKRFRAEADQLRKEIKQIDADYDAAVRGLFSGLEGIRDEKLTALREKFVEARASAEEKANRDAEEQMARLNKAFGQTLAEEREISLPGQPGKTLQSPPIDLRDKMPNLAPILPLDDREAAVHDQLTIWSAVKGYRIVTTQSAGRDGTSEFLEWLRSHLPGP